MDAAAAFFLSGFIFFIAGTFLFLKRDSVGIKSVIAIANSKNTDIAELKKDRDATFMLINDWTEMQKLIAVRCERLEARPWASLQTDVELLKQSKKKENFAIDLFFYDGVKKTLAPGKKKPLEAVQ